MKLWEITQEKLADDVAAHGNIKQEPKNDKLRLKEMSKKCVKEIQGKVASFEKSRKKARAQERSESMDRSPFPGTSLDSQA